MAVDADTAASALATSWQHFIKGTSGWARREGGVLGTMSGVAMAGCNGAWTERVNPDAATVAALLDDVAASGLPHCLQLRPGAGPALRALPFTRGMVPEAPVPLMTLDDAGSLDAARQVEGLKIRQIPPDDVGAHVAIGAKGFGVTEQLYGQLSTPAAMRLPGVRCYVGEVAGTPVTTGLGVTLAPFVAIFSIATPPAYRGRGYASAVTARAVGDGLANGAEWAWLQSSEAARQIYTRLGFRTVELWDCWVAANGQ